MTQSNRPEPELIHDEDAPALRALVDAFADTSLDAAIQYIEEPTAHVLAGSVFGTGLLIGILVARLDGEWAERALAPAMSAEARALQEGELRGLMAEHPGEEEGES